MITPTPCPSGSYCPISGMISTTPCPSGSYCPISSVSPISCQAGYYCTVNSSSPTPCPSGYYCLAGSSSPTPCTTGIEQCRVNCVVSDWSSFGACSASCGGGTQSHTRTITTQPQYGGTSCPVLTESQSCNTQGCPVNCQVSGWSGFGACSASCGGGTQTQTRYITVNPANGGTACPVLSESQSCNTQPCTLPNGSGCSVGSQCSGGYCNNGVCYSGPAVNSTSTFSYDNCYNPMYTCDNLQNEPLTKGFYIVTDPENGGVNNTGHYNGEIINYSNCIDRGPWTPELDAQCNNLRYN